MTPGLESSNRNGFMAVLGSWITDTPVLSPETEAAGSLMPLARTPVWDDAMAGLCSLTPTASEWPVCTREAHTQPCGVHKLLDGMSVRGNRR